MSHDHVVTPPSNVNIKHMITCGKGTSYANKCAGFKFLFLTSCCA